MSTITTKMQWSWQTTGNKRGQCQLFCLLITYIYSIANIFAVVIYNLRYIIARPLAGINMFSIFIMSCNPFKLYLSCRVSLLFGQSQHPSLWANHLLAGLEHVYNYFP